MILEQFDNSLLRAHILYIYKLRSAIFISESKTRRHFVYDVIKRRQSWLAHEKLLISVQIYIVFDKILYEDMQQPSLYFTNIFFDLLSLF